METGTQSIKIKTNIAHLGDIEIEICGYDDVGKKARDLLSELTRASVLPESPSEEPCKPQ
jgi:hypothetical protein